MVFSVCAVMVGAATRLMRQMFRWLVALFTRSDEARSELASASLTQPILKIPAYLTVERKVTLTWLRERAPSLAELYETALSMMYEHYLPARIRLVSHCMRDIANRLPDAVATSTIAGRVEYPPLVDRIAARWPPAPPQLAIAETPELPPDMAVPREAYTAVDALLQAHAAGSTRFEQKLQILFGGGDATSSSLIQPAVESFKRTAKWFMKRAHDRGDIDALMAEESELQSYFEAFERGLYPLAAEWSKGQDNLDAFLEEANRRTD